MIPLQRRLGRARRSVYGKLMTVIFASTAAALVFAGIGMMMRDLTVYRHDWNDEMDAEARIIALATAPALALDDHNLAMRNLTALGANGAVLTAALYRPDGTLYAAYSRSQATVPARIGLSRRERITRCA